MATIKLKDNRIKFDFENDKGEIVETLYFDKSDKNVGRFMKKYKDIQKMQVDGADNYDVDKIKDEIKEYMNDIFGEDSFDKLYSLNPSILIVATYFLEMSMEIQETIRREQEGDIVNKYLKNK
ncbi:hypothetical protein [Helcococcus kunzii]|uniref:hypothetical protein n=1 Tax=Helcococcus kunzii TaxID=40091 RepID=UPI0038A5E43C